jgi:broad specificity phosphatase PhoE
VTRIVLVRHAEPAASVRGRCYGSLDVELSPRGRRQAGALARALGPLAAVYSSPRRRALETARALGEPIVVDALREIDFGELEGHAYEEIERERPELFARWMTAPTTVRFPGGESYAELRDRVRQALADIRARGAVASLAIDLDAVLGDTRPLWRDWLADLERRSRVGLDGLPDDRVAAAERLDALVGNWRDLLGRFAEDRAPVYLRPDARATAALRRLTRLAAFTDAPEPLAQVAAAHLGATRRVEAVEAGPGARERALERLGTGAGVVASLAELEAAAR